MSQALNVHIAEGTPFEYQTDVLVLGVFEDGELDGPAKELDTRLKGVLGAAIGRHEFRGKWLEVWSTYTAGAAAHRVLVLGLGKKEQFGLAELRQAAGQSSQWAISQHAKSLAWVTPAIVGNADQVAEVMAEGLLLGAWAFTPYTQEPHVDSLTEASLLGLPAEAKGGIERGRIIATAQNLVRDLGQRPSNKLYPELLAEEARRQGQDHGFEVEVFDEGKLKELGMEALLGVGSGSIYPPRMVIMRYQGGGNRTLALVGKGITFDSGGISLKPGLGMEEMKYDMLGSGAVLGAMIALADMKVPLNVVGIMAIAQNMPSGSAYKPGDVVKAFNGKTIEVTNTDAEGRVALSDAVSYAAHLGVNWIVETSTLTGAAITVLGHEATALVATDDGLASMVLQASETAGERVWRLPIYPEYKKLYKSDVADMKNAPGREAGTITAGMIIAEFVGNVPFAHLDIAGSAWTPAGPLNRTKNGPTGVMVRTFVELAERLTR